MNVFTGMLLPLIAAILLAPMTACALSGKAIEGKVLEEGTNKPIPGAIVVARWQGHLATFAHGKTVCYHVLSTTTGENGNYRFPAWKKEVAEDWQKNVRPEDVIIAAHKPGYRESERYEKNVQYLQPFTGGRGERLQYLDRVISSTSCGDKSTHQNLYRIHRAVYEEARAIAQTEEEKKQVERLKWIAEYSLVNLNKPTKSDGRGRTINVDPNDSFKPEDLLKEPLINPD